MPIKPSYLRLLVDEGSSKNTTSLRSQPDLFSTPSVCTLGFILTTGASGSSFVNALRHLRPRSVVDLRPVPLFDFPGFSRRELFTLSSDLRFRYLDLLGILQIKTSRQADTNPAIIASQIVTFSGNDDGFMTGPIAFLVDEPEYLRVASNVIPSKLPTRHGPWDVIVCKLDGD